MRRYRIEIRGRTFEIDVDELGTDRFQVVVDNETYEVSLDSNEDLPEARITPEVDTSAAPSAEAAHRREASASSDTPKPAADPVPRAAVRRATGAATGLICAPMPGAIVEVNVTVGQKVRRGDVVAVLEAMKMNNGIRAPRDGVVAEVLVSEGQGVKHGEPLVRLEG